MSLVYLAGPVDAVTQSEAQTWREQAAAALTHRGIATFSPPHAFGADPSILDQETCEKISRINDAALRESDACLANLGGVSYGTPLECNLAIQAGIPIFAFGLSEYSIYRFRMTEWTSRQAPDDLYAPLVTSLGRSARR